MKEADQTISYAIWNMIVCMRDLMEKPRGAVLKELAAMDADADIRAFGDFISKGKQ